VQGETVGSYKILGKISEGGMGVVYRAEHALIGKSAAVKLLHPELSANQDIVNRFFNEAKAATAIRHPGIVEVFDFGYMANGMAFIVMEFLDGEPLSKRLATRGRLEEREALSLIRGTASALAAAHAKGIIHRDLKPDNIFLVPDPDMAGGERPKLLDFGIAKLTDAAKGGLSSSKTSTGAVMGTPTYMSPEQCRGAGEIDHRSDLYALGCILYEMVCGKPPFVAEGIGEIIGFHLFMAPNPPSQIVPGISANTEALILNLLAKKPEDRIQSAIELARLLGHGSTPSANTMGFSHGVRLPTAPVVVAQGTVPGSYGGYTPVPGALTNPSAQAPTTLSGSAAQASSTPPPKKSRTGLFVALAVSVIGGGAVAGVMATRGGGGGDDDKTETQPAGAPTADVTPDPKDPPPPAITVDAGAAVVVAPADAAPAATAADAGAAVVATDKPDKDKRDPKKPRKPKDPKKPDPTTGPKVPKGPAIETDI